MNALWPSALVIGSVSLPLDDVLADVAIHHGRTDVNDDPTPDTCQITLQDVEKPYVDTFHIGASLVLTVKDQVTNAESPRFTGRVTDASLDVDLLTVIAVGRLSTLGSYPIGGTVDYPAEPWSARVVRVFTEAGLVDQGAFTNRITNPGFEAAVGAEWYLYNATLVPDTTDPHAGASAGRYQKTVADGYVAMFGLLNGTPIPRARGTLSGWMKGPAGATGQIQVNEAGGAAGDQALCTLHFTFTGQWQYLYTQGDLIQPDRTTLYLLVSSAAAVGAPVYLDDLAFRYGNSLLELFPDPAFDPQLAARDHLTAGATTLADYLAFLAPMVGAAVTDRMDGRIMVQAIGARTAPSAVALPPELVLYAPAWKQFLPTGNVVTVRYTGDQSQSVTAIDSASVGLYGERPYTIDTSFVNVADATYRANLRLARGAFPHWNIPEAPVLEGLALQVGAPLILTEMPPASPFDPWQPIVEGWTDTISGDSWTMTVALSDPLASGLTLPWYGVPSTAVYHWDTVDPATDWTEALTLEALSAG